MPAKKTPKKIASASPKKKPLPVHVAVIIDESGSMSSCEQATRSSFNEFIEVQKQDKAVASITLTAFNTACRKVFSGVQTKSAPLLTEKNYCPHGLTALHDAVGVTVNALMKAVPKKHRVLCCIMTDGQENASKEYDLSDIKALIEKMQKTKLWTFVFIGANQNAWYEGSKMGIPIGNAINYAATPAGTMAAGAGLICNTSAYTHSAAGSTQTFWGGQRVVTPAKTPRGKH
jgi:hypothetical protein